MYEVELKVRANHERVKARLETLDATPVESVRQTDTYYDAPDRNFAETDEALRVRRERPIGSAGERAAVTYKGPLVESESKTRQEAETFVGDAEGMADILSGLGYEPAATVSKERDSYRLDDCTVTLDVVDGLGEFVEVELESEADLDEEDARLETLRDRAIGVLDDLGLDASDQIRTSYLGLLSGIEET